MNQLAIDIGGLSPYEADQMRRAFSRKNATELLKAYWGKFRAGALEKGIEEKTAIKIFRKMNGHYMFPEAHAVAFGVTSYQLAWLKYYHPLEFFTALINQQPMGFWGLETLKQDAKRHGIRILNPDINKSDGKCTIEGGCIRLGLVNVANVGEAASKKVLEERAANGLYKTLGDLMHRTGLQREVVESLVEAAAFDSLDEDRRSLLWESGLRYRPAAKQLTLDLPVEQDLVALEPLSDWDQMALEYGTLGLHPNGHLMGKLRSRLGKGLATSEELQVMKDGRHVRVAGLVARPLQHPLANAYFMTLEDEHGFIPLIIWTTVYEKYRNKLREPLLLVEGTVSRREGTLNVVVNTVRVLELKDNGKGAHGQASDFIRPPRPMFR